MLEYRPAAHREIVERDRLARQLLAMPSVARPWLSAQVISASSTGLPARMRPLVLAAADRVQQDVERGFAVLLEFGIVPFPSVSTPLNIVW